MRFSNVNRDISIQKPKNDTAFKGYRILGPAQIRSTGLFGMMSELARHAVAVLDGAEEPRSTVKDALATYAACVELAKRFEKR